MNKHLIACLLGILLVISSCGRKNIPTGPDVDPNSLNIQQVDFEYLSTKSKIKYQDSNQNLSASATIRFRKDSLIWISVSPALGIEAARCLITQDSITIINKLNKEYYVENFESLSQKFNIEINFDLIQAMLLGNLPKNKLPLHKVVKQNDHFLIKQVDGRLLIDNYVSRKNMKVEKVTMEEYPTDNSLLLEYGNFKSVEQFLIPFKNLISLSYGPDASDKTVIEIEHSKAEVGNKDLSFPFSIPQKYERK
jgi:hypothetical protein